MNEIESTSKQNPTAERIERAAREVPPNAPLVVRNRFTIGYASGWNAALREAARIVREESA